MIINFENSATHQYVVQTAKTIKMARSEMTGNSFLVIKKLHKQYFEKSSCKLLSFNICTDSSWAYNGRCVASWNL